MATRKRGKSRRIASAAAEARRAATQVRAYFATQPPVARRALRRLRDAIRAAAPGAVEGFSYRMPVFRYEGRPLVWYAAFKAHCSLFPMTPEIRRVLGRALDGYETSKGTVRFPLTPLPPVALVKRLVKARLGELRATLAQGPGPRAGRHAAP